MMRLREGQILVFDADDTLWENNVIFERVISAFLDWTCTPAKRTRTRALLDEIEAENVVALGYGTQMFRQSLCDCLQRLNGRTPTAAEHGQIEELLEPLMARRIELIDGVADTLATLAKRHELLLLTKGDPAEQQWKVDASRIAHHFRSIHIVAEKTMDTYLKLSADLQLAVDRTWMIGNSPRSDIMPARRAGLKAVYIPHDHTWVLEQEEFSPDQDTLYLRTFAELLLHF